MALLLTGVTSVRYGPCFPFKYEQTWSQVQACFATDTTQAVYLTTDAYGIHHLIDDINFGGKTFSSASDNGGGINDPAAPTATTDPSLLPPLPIPIPQTG